MFSSFPLRSLLGAKVLSFACSSPAGGMLFGVSGLLLLLFANCVNLTRCCFRANTNKLITFSHNECSHILELILPTSLQVCMEHLFISGIKLINLVSKASLMSITLVFGGMLFGVSGLLL